jgi:putative protease
MRAAIRAGADAVYFGLQGFNARARAQNFDAASLKETLDELHAHGVRGYVTLNTLVFDCELVSAEAAIVACARAGVDAVIVQDLGVMRLIRAVAPELPIHASTQMTCTDAESVELARSLGAARVILARELSVADIAAIREKTDCELEVFVHGALCVAYSGQCLTSEAIGGRSANRGACAQACRLPYELLVDGVLRDLGERAYLLSPEDLEASALVPELSRLGISSLKIEGRLKGPEYVAAATRLYRAAVDLQVEQSLRDAALQTYSRGSGPGFLGGIDHQRLVDGRTCDHRGLTVGDFGELRRVRGRTSFTVALKTPLSRGDGLLIEGAWGGEGEVGGRVWSIAVGGRDVEHAPAGETALVWLGPDKALPDTLSASPRRVFKTDDPAVDRGVLASIERAPHRVKVNVTVSGAVGELPRFEAEGERGLHAAVTGDAALATAEKHPLTDDVLRDKLGSLGDTPFELDGLHNRLPAGVLLPLSSLKRVRRSLVSALVESGRRSWPVASVDAKAVVSACAPPAREAPPAGLYVLCRTLEQARAAVASGADGVYLDFLELTGMGAALRTLRDEGAPFVGVAPPRIRKPGEEKIDRYLEQLAPDAMLVRGLGALHEGSGEKSLRIGDFSLNVVNRLAAEEVLARGCNAFTPSFDLDAVQLAELLDSPFGPWAELVLYHPMPLFHMEHCVFAALLSNGSDHRTCGRPCETHQVALRDRAGMDHPVIADVGCRNTVFHAAAQSGAQLVASTRKAGVRRYRIELLREGAAEVTRIVETHRALLAGTIAPSDLFRTLRTEGGYGVVRGSLRVLP